MFRYRVRGEYPIILDLVLERRGILLRYRVRNGYPVAGI